MNILTKNDDHELSSARLSYTADRAGLSHLLLVGFFFSLRSSSSHWLDCFSPVGQAYLLFGWKITIFVSMARAIFSWNISIPIGLAGLSPH